VNPLSYPVLHFAHPVLQRGLTSAHPAALNSLDLDTMNRRIDERVARDPTDFGGKPEERELAVRLHQTKEDVPKNGIIIDATRPLEHVVDEILRAANLG
jgi:uncharacterized protein YheU (UPF0270 family)